MVRLGCIIAMKLTAAEFNRRYGSLVRRKYSKCRTARILRLVLARRVPPIFVTDGVLKYWFQKYVRRRSRSSFPSSSSVQELLSRSEGGDIAGIRCNGPVWASRVRRRLSFLQQLILACENEKIHLINI